jgi:hypothetical protein
MKNDAEDSFKPFSVHLETAWARVVCCFNLAERKRLYVIAESRLTGDAPFAATVLVYLDLEHCGSSEGWADQKCTRCGRNLH